MVEASSVISVPLGELVFCVGGGWFLYMQDQYVNHIMNETGATVLLRGHGSGSSETGFGEGCTCDTMQLFCKLVICGV